MDRKFWVWGTVFSFLMLDPFLATFALESYPNYEVPINITAFTAAFSFISLGFIAQKEKPPVKDVHYFHAWLDGFEKGGRNG